MASGLNDLLHHNKEIILNTLPKILVSSLFALLFCNIAYAMDIQPAHTKHFYFSSENGCQQVNMFFKFTNQFMNDERVHYFVAKNFNVETTMPVDGWGTDQGFVFLPQGDSIIYKNTYTTSPAIITGSVSYNDKKISRILCSLSFYHDALKDSCHAGVTMGSHCVPGTGNGTEDDPLVIRLLKPL